MSSKSGYVLDTNVILDLTRRRYPAAVFPKIHEQMDALINQGLVISSIEVVGELLDKVPAKNPDNWLTSTQKTYPLEFNLAVDWAKQHAHIFKELDTSLEGHIKDILEQFPGAVKMRSNTGFDADPHLIALAIASDWAVVTHETSDFNNPRIPDICKSLQPKPVKCIDLLTVCKDNSWVF